MKILFIGGTGLISTAVTELALSKGIDVTLLNRGNDRHFETQGAKYLIADWYNKQEAAKALAGQHFDVAVNWIAFSEEQVRHDYELLNGKVGQYIFISSASAYQKPCGHYKITESTPLVNPYWEYSRKKIDCERYLTKRYITDGFPVTIVRPSHTYGHTKLPFAFGTSNAWTVLDRMLKGRPIVVHGDGTSLWTLTHNTDFASGFLGLCGLYKSIGQAFHITSDEALTWNNIHKTIAHQLGIEAVLMHIPSRAIEKNLPQYTGCFLGDKSESVIFDNSKIKDYVPGWNAVVTHAEGVRRAIALFDENPSLKVIDDSYNQQMDKLIDTFSNLISY